MSALKFLRLPSLCFSLVLALSLLAAAPLQAQDNDAAANESETANNIAADVAEDAAENEAPASGAREDAPPIVESNVETVNNTGFYTVSWHPPKDEDATEADPDAKAREVVLEEAISDTFIDALTIYEGLDEATVLSGRLNGTYFYRARWQDGPPEAWSEVVSVEVEHYSLLQALLVLAIGALVFLATAFLIVAGHFAHRRDVAAGMFDEVPPSDGEKNKAKD